MDVGFFQHRHRANFIPRPKLRGLHSLPQTLQGLREFSNLVKKLTVTLKSFTC